MQEATSQVKRYVLGFAFNLLGTHVVLIQKKRPAWQYDKWNGVGGKIEENEDQFEAMVREFREETGLDTQIDEWKAFGELRGEFGIVYLFSRFSTDIGQVKTVTAEPVAIHFVPDIGVSNTIDNVPWLVRAAATGQWTKVTYITADYSPEVR